MTNPSLPAGSADQNHGKFSPHFLSRALKIVSPYNPKGPCQSLHPWTGLDQNLTALQWRGEKISMLTAYDYSMAKILDRASIDVILVGDSASNVMAGHETTIPITLDEMIYHAASVVRAVERALVVVDMPFGSYQGNSKEALNSAIRIMKETGASSVKLEGGQEIQESVIRILKTGKNHRLTRAE